MRTLRYQWFLSAAFNSFEQILCSVDVDQSWTNAIEAQVGYHVKMLDARWADWKDHYGPEFRTLVERVMTDSRTAHAHS